MPSHQYPIAHCSPNRSFIHSPLAREAETRPSAPRACTMHAISATATSTTAGCQTSAGPRGSPVPAFVPANRVTARADPGRDAARRSARDRGGRPAAERPPPALRPWSRTGACNRMRRPVGPPAPEISRAITRRVSRRACRRRRDRFVVSAWVVARAQPAKRCATVIPSRRTLYSPHAFASLDR